MQYFSASLYSSCWNGRGITISWNTKVSALRSQDTMTILSVKLHSAILQIFRFFGSLMIFYGYFVSAKLQTMISKNLVQANHGQPILNMGLSSSQGLMFSIFSLEILNSKAFILSTPLVCSIKAPTTFSPVFKINGRHWSGLSMKFHETMASSTTSRRGIVYFYLATFSFVVSIFMILRPLCSLIA